MLVGLHNEPDKGQSEEPGFEIMHSKKGGCAREERQVQIRCDGASREVREVRAGVAEARRGRRVDGRRHVGFRPTRVGAFVLEDIAVRGLRGGRWGRVLRQQSAGDQHRGPHFTENREK